MVISLEVEKLIFSKMGYRGSKSEKKIIIPQPNKIFSVKEQRVDGSYFGFSSKLRCTLMGGESRYQVKIPSKQIYNNKNFSSLTTKNTSSSKSLLLTITLDP